MDITGVLELHGPWMRHERMVYDPSNVALALAIFTGQRNRGHCCDTARNARLAVAKFLQ